MDRVIHALVWRFELTGGGFYIQLSIQPIKVRGTPRTLVQRFAGCRSPVSSVAVVVALFNPLQHGGLRSLEFVVTLQISRLEIDKKLQVITMQAGAGANLSSSTKHSFF
jgi:hypothetical protein